MIKKTFYVNSFINKTKKVGDNLRIEGYANTITKDRQGDVIVSSAWVKGVDNYRKNPILLWNHEASKPIGRVTNMKIDGKGLFIEANISSAAEKQYSIWKLIEDEVLKSFSVGFIVKDQKYDSHSDSSTITDVELLEISIVSIPANQESLFSLKKSFSNENEYKEFVKSFELPEKKTLLVGTSSMADEHYHALEIDEIGKGRTTFTSHGHTSHTHEIVDKTIQPMMDHIHTVRMLDVVEGVDNEPTGEIPLIEPLEEMSISVESTDKIEEIKEEDKKENLEQTIVTDKMTSEDIGETTLETAPKTIQEENSEGSSKDFKISDGLSLGKIVKYNNRRWKIKKIPSSQLPTFQLKVVDDKDTELEEVLNIQVDELQIQDTEEVKSLIIAEPVVETPKETLEVAAKTLNNEVIKPSEEKNNMTGQAVSEPLTVADAKKAAENTTEVTSSVQVAAPRVEQLVNQAGAKTVEVATTETVSAKQLEEMRVLTAEMSKYKDQIAAMQNDKVVHAQQTQKSQFTPEQLADAYLLCKGYAGAEGYFGDGEKLFDYTKAGRKIKAVTSVDAFLSNFTNQISKEMEQALVIAPLFQKVTVDAKTFRIPVSDEDESGAVAQFPSGTYATGIGDVTNVPTSAQNTIKAVELKPIKFMSTVHLAKDEEEDTVLALMPFLREGCARRTARAIDKALLRGDATLAAFGASPTNYSAGTGYQSPIRGIATHCYNAGAQTLVVNTGVSTQATPTNIASARAKLGKYGLRVGTQDLVYLTTVEGYNELVQTSDFRTVDTFGPQATYHTGTLGAIWGIPVMVTEFLDNKGSSGNWVGLLVYRPSWKLGEMRGILVESEYQPRQQVTAIYISTRLDMKPLTTNASGMLDSTYPLACLMVSS